MKRLGVIAFYDPDGIADNSAVYLLNSLTEVLDKLIIIINGEMNDESFQVLNRYSKDIIVRTNAGFDGGAYQDFFLHYIDQEEVLEYDEIVLLNNTFYGPFYPWGQVFERMNQRFVDFWGLSKHLEYYSPARNRLIKEYIQSYFLVFKKTLFTDDAFWLFWKSMKPIRCFEDVMINYEFSLTDYFHNKGFQYAVYTDLFPECGFLQKRDQVVYSTFCYDLLKECYFPVLKKRDGVSVFNPQTKPAIDYIRKNYEYDLDMLWENAFRTLKKARLFVELEPFYRKHSSIFLYGSGKIAREIELYFSRKKWEISGYIETDPHTVWKNGKSVIAWNKFQMEDGVGVIVALSRKNTEEVKEYLPESEDIMLLY